MFPIPFVKIYSDRKSQSIAANNEIKQLCNSLMEAASRSIVLMILDLSVAYHLRLKRVSFSRNPRVLASARSGGMHRSRRAS